MEQDHVEICGREIGWTDYSHEGLYPWFTCIGRIKYDYWLGVF